MDVMRKYTNDREPPGSTGTRYPSRIQKYVPLPQRPQHKRYAQKGRVKIQEMTHPTEDHAPNY